MHNTLLLPFLVIVFYSAVQCVTLERSISLPSNQKFLNYLAGNGSVIVAPIFGPGNSPSAPGSNCSLLLASGNAPYSANVIQMEPYLPNELCVDNWVNSIAMNDQFIAIGHVSSISPNESRVIVVTYNGTQTSNIQLIVVPVPDPGAVIGVSVALGLSSSNTMLFIGAQNIASLNTSVLVYALNQSSLFYWVNTQPSNVFDQWNLGTPPLMAAGNVSFGFYGCFESNAIALNFLSIYDFSWLYWIPISDAVVSLSVTGNFAAWSSTTLAKITNIVTTDQVPLAPPPNLGYLTNSTLICTENCMTVVAVVPVGDYVRVFLYNQNPKSFSFNFGEEVNASGELFIHNVAVTNNYLAFRVVDSKYNEFLQIYSFADYTAFIIILVIVVLLLIAAAIIAIVFGIRKWKQLKKKREKNQISGKDEPAKEVNNQGTESAQDHRYQGMPAAIEDKKYQGIPSPSVAQNSANKSKQSEKEVIKSTNTGSSVITLQQRLQVPWADITILRQIGKGSYGKVCLGKWQHTEVAVKFCSDIGNAEEFLKEAELMINIPPHPNIVQVLGVSTDGPHPVIILEYCAGGSLDKYLFGNDVQLTEKELIAIVAGIAKGMLHLHKHKIIHRDLAARNILLTEAKQPKISDFGLSRFLQQAQEGKTNSSIGPLRWMAPESLSERVYSTKTDVWTFGIVIWEIVAKQEPHLDQDPLNVGKLIRDENLLPKIPPDCPPLLAELMQMCWKRNPEERPDFEQICSILLRD